MDLLDSSEIVLHIQFKRELIYSESLDMLVLVCRRYYGMIYLENQDGLRDHLSSCIFLQTGKPWKIIDEWYES